MSTRHRVVKSCCQASHSECGVLVHVRNGKVVKIEGDPSHPFSRGLICTKGRNYNKLLYIQIQLVVLPSNNIGDVRFRFLSIKRTSFQNRGRSTRTAIMVVNSNIDSQPLIC